MAIRNLFTICENLPHYFENCLVSDLLISTRSFSNTETFVSSRLGKNGENKDYGQVSDLLIIQLDHAPLHLRGLTFLCV